MRFVSDFFNPTSSKSNFSGKYPQDKNIEKALIFNTSFEL
jgi:hypothetical protein